MSKRELGSLVWVEDPEECYLPGRVIELDAKGQPVKIQREDDGEIVKIDGSSSMSLIDCNPEVLDSEIFDLINISDLNEMSILHNLRIRFKEDKIYTRISSILISVNPFKLLPLYTPKVLDRYKQGIRGLPPHIYAIAYLAYNNIISSNDGNQSIVISGESGAGKSEACKLILQFLTDISMSHSASQGVSSNVPTSSSLSSSSSSTTTTAAVVTNTPAATSVSSSSSSSSSMTLTDTNIRSLTSQHASSAAAIGISSLEQKILAANPILEAFGNAKTLRNNNSSRFGKLITVNFDRQGSIIGGGIVNYLLEKSRVVKQSAGERNYHIFYQLLTCAGIDEELTEELYLQSPDLFDYTNKSKVITVDGISDERDFEDVMKSMTVLGFSSIEQKEILRVVAGILQFGNVRFKKIESSTDFDGSSIANETVLKNACLLLGLDHVEMSKFLCSRLIGTKEVILVNLPVEQAQDTRDAMVKKVYAEMFQSIVDKINTVLSTSSYSASTGRSGKRDGGEKESVKRFIGVLDIFGFESFEVNSFEQLCINFCNEKLQFHFNEHIFKMEQAVYADEGICIPQSSFVDNQPTLDLLELKGTGIFAMCDEEINVPRGSDEGFLQKVLQKHADGKHPNCLKPKSYKDCKDPLKNFGILHYAGPVYYNVTNFLEKNKDQLHSDIVNVLKNSTCNLVKCSFNESDSTGNQGSSGNGQISLSNSSGSSSNNSNNKPSSIVAKKPPTLGSLFKVHLNQLIDTLNATRPHFVRCMKSNDDKAGNVFTSPRMLDQLRYAGLVEVCRIRKLGYPIRQTFTAFYKRFRCCDMNCSDLDSLLDVLVRRGILKHGEWAKGRTRIFLRQQQSVELEVAREEAFALVVVSVQKIARGYVCREKMKKFKRILSQVATAMTSREELQLSKALDMVFELPGGAMHLETIKQAKSLLHRVKEENRITSLLESSIACHELNSLRNAISAAESFDGTFCPPCLAQAKQMLARLEAEISCKNGLLEAIHLRSMQQLVQFLQMAEEGAFINCMEYSQAKALKHRLDHEQTILEKLSALAADSMDNSVENNVGDAGDERLKVERLNAALSEAMELGLETSQEYVKAEQVKENLVAKIEENEAEERRVRLELENAHLKRNKEIEDATKNLKFAYEERDVEGLIQAMQVAMDLNLPESAEMEEYRQFLKEMDETVELGKEIDAAIEMLRFKAETGILPPDIEPLHSAILRADNLDIPPQNIDVGLRSYEMYKLHIVAREELTSSLSSKDCEKLKTAIEFAENLNIKTEMLTRAKEMLRGLEIISRKQKMALGLDGSSEGNENSSGKHQRYDAAEEARRIKRETAMQPRFALENFPNLRSRDDYARGIFFNKWRVKEMMLQFETGQLNRSLTELIDYFNSIAIQIWKDLLGYTGERNMPFPAMLAKDILNKGYEHPPLRDEIYVQIIKHLTNNPRPDSISRGWQLLCLCVGTFPPSAEFENFLMHFIINASNDSSKKSTTSTISSYAKYSLRTLEGMLGAGGGGGEDSSLGFVPSVEEILAYKERPPILATISLVDGTTITENLPVTPDYNVGKVLEMCIEWLDMRDPRYNTLGIFVYDEGDDDVEGPIRHDEPYSDLPRTPRPLRNDEFLGDVVLQRSRAKRRFKFVLKKKIFLPNDFVKGQDIRYDKLVFMQAEDDAIIQGNILIESEEKAAHLATLSMYLAYGDRLGQSEGELVDQHVLDFVVPGWRNQHNPEYWAQLVLQINDECQLHLADPEIIQNQFVSTLEESPLYGNHWFYVHRVPTPADELPSEISQLPMDIILAFNCEGMCIYSTDRVLLTGFPYADIIRWGGTLSHFSLIINSDELAEPFEFIVITSQSLDLAAMILDYINSLVDIDIEDEDEDEEDDEEDDDEEE